MEEGVIFAWDMGIKDVIFEGDSKIVWDALLGIGLPPVVVANILTGVFDRL